MTPEQEQLRDAFLAECWKPVREVSGHIRAEKRKADRALNQRIEELADGAVHSRSPEGPDLPTRSSTPCAQNGGQEIPKEATESRPDMAGLVYRHKSTPGSVVRATDGSRGLAS